MGTLFEPTRKAWVFQNKAGGFGSSDILDEQGEKIGEAHRVTGKTGARVEFKEVDGSKACEVRQKIDAIQYIYDVKDSEGKSLGRIKNGRINTPKPKLQLKIEDDKKLFEAIGKALGGIFVIRDVSGKEVAILNRIDKGKNIVGKGKSAFKERFGLRINDAYVGKLDARQLVGFLVAIEDISLD